MSMPRAYAEYVLEDLPRRVFSEDARPLALRQPRILNCMRGAIRNAQSLGVRYALGKKKWPRCRRSRYRSQIGADRRCAISDGTSQIEPPLKREEESKCNYTFVMIDTIWWGKPGCYFS